MNTRVYIGRLPDAARDRHVEQFFKGYGRIREILLKNGYGFVEFEDARDADDAVYDLNGKELCGERIIVEHARSPGSRTAASYDRRPAQNDRVLPPLRTPYRVIVENISSRTSWQELKEHLTRVGEVTFADAHKEHLNEGVAEFATLGDMKNAVTKLNNTELNGRRIHLYEDSNSSRRRSRSRSKGRRRSDSRPRNRSRSRSARNGRSRSGSRRRTERRRSRTRSRSASPSRRASRSPRASRSRSPRQRSVSRKRDRSRSRESPRRSVKREKHSASRSRSRHRSAARDDRKSANRTGGGDADRSRSRSPRKASRSPRKSSRSPRRASRSPRKASRSPRKASRSPRKSSRSPRGRSASPAARRRSPSPGANGRSSPKRKDRSRSRDNK